MFGDSLAAPEDDLLECPITRGRLRARPGQGYAAADGPVYPVIDGVAHFLGETLRSDGRENDESRSIREFYQSDGWKQGDDGLYEDSRSFVDMRAVAHDFQTRCIRRIGRYFKGGGKYLLDAGSGPIPQDALLDYSASFEKRVCVDLSAEGLKAARAKLGERGVYLQADVAKLPIQSNAVDAITCNHVIYQIPAHLQHAAFLELWRVLKPGGVAVIVYWWPDTPLEKHLGRCARLFSLLTGMRGQRAKGGHWPELYHHPHSLAWFKSQAWPFRYEFDTLRTIGNGFTQHHVSDDWRGRFFLGGVFALQQVAPRYCGQKGLMPAIVFRKPAVEAQAAAA